MALASGPGREFSRHINHWLGVLALAWLGGVVLSRPVLAAGTRAPAVVDTMVVAATAGTDLSRLATTSLVTRIDVSAESGSADLADLLGRVAGLQMARLGGWGASAVPSMRGSSGAQIRFLVDGMPLPAAQTGTAAFSRLPLDRLQAVEVYRGTVPAGLGGVGGVGAINFITRRGVAGLAADLQAGSFGLRGARLTVGGRRAGDSGGWLVGVTGRRTDNDYTYRDHNQTFHRTDDDTLRVRRNAWLREHGAWGSGQWHLGSWSGRGSLGFDRRDGGRPGPLAYPSPGASVRYDRWDGQLHLADGRRRLAADLAGGRSYETLYHPVAGEIGFLPAGTTRTRADDLSGRLAWSPPTVAGALALETGLSWQGQWHNETINTAAEPERSRRTTVAFAALTVDLAPGRLQLTPAWRWQRTSDNFPLASAPGPDAASHRVREDVSPSLGVVWTIRPARLYAAAHAARTVRVPTWVELFGHRGGVDGNPTLGAEEITTADLALGVRGPGPLAGRLAGFVATTDDKIIFVQNSQRTSKALNLGRTVARGLEAELTLDLPARWRLAGNLTLQRVTDRGTDPAYRDNELPFLPDLEAHGRLDGGLGDWHPWLAASRMSANYRDRANTELDRAPARSRWDLGCRRDWYPGWVGPGGAVSLEFELINLSDNTVYDVEGFPLPGRSWHLAVNLRR